MDLRYDFPALWQLSQAGFHQDFQDTDGTPQEVVSTLATDPVLAARLPGEVDRLVAQHPGPALEEALDAFGSNYDHAADGLSAREWLAEVVVQVEREAPPPDPRYAALVGQQVLAVAGGETVTMTLERATVELRTEGWCSAPGGVARVGPGTDVSALAQAVGEPVLCAVESRGQLKVATPHVDVFTLPAPEGEGFAVRAREEA